MIPAGRDLRGYQVQSPHCVDGDTEAQSELVTELRLRHGFHSPFIHSLSAGCKRLLFLKDREMDLRRNNHSVSGPREAELPRDWSWHTAAVPDPLSNFACKAPAGPSHCAAPPPDYSVQHITSLNPDHKPMTLGLGKPP